MAMTVRTRRVLAAMKKAGVEALLVTDAADVRYLCGFTGSNAAVLVRPGKMVLFTDGRYTEQARLEVEGAEVVIVAAGPVAGAAVQAAVAAGAGSCGFDAGKMTVAGLEGLKAGLPAKLRRGWFVAATGLLAKLREVKDDGEQQRMREAAELGGVLFDHVLEHMVPGATEMEVAMALEYMARLNGAEGMSFETIVAGGERSALPHGRATNAKLPRRGFVVLDFGVVLDGYCSDMTRTVHMGAERKGEREVYEAVLEAQEAGLAAVKAGVLASDVDEAARSVLRGRGLEEWFTHSTGHGVGVEIHEGPRLGKKRPGTPDTGGEERLKAGMVVTIEPGVYMPGKFGVRIEDTVLVTHEGCEVLTPSTKAWIEL